MLPEAPLKFNDDLEKRKILQKVSLENYADLRVQSFVLVLY